MTTQADASSSSSKGNRMFLIGTLLVLVAVAAVAGAAVLISHTQPRDYGCISISYNGSTLDLSTPGLIHVDGSQYYVSCNDGTDDGDLPTSTFNVSCVTITPKEIISSFPGAAPTYYYYVTAGAHTVTLVGASTNSTVILQPNNAYLQVTCS